MKSNSTENPKSKKERIPNEYGGRPTTPKSPENYGKQPRKFYRKLMEKLIKETRLKIHVYKLKYGVAQRVRYE